MEILKKLLKIILQIFKLIFSIIISLVIFIIFVELYHKFCWDPLISGLTFLLIILIFNLFIWSKRHIKISSIIFAIIALMIICTSKIEIFIDNLDDVHIYTAKGIGMAPIIDQWDKFAVDTRIKDFKRGELAVYKIPKEKGTYYQRVIAIEGDIIEIKRNNKSEGVVYLNGDVLDEPYRESLYEDSPAKEANHFGPYKVPKDCYFILGDQRDLSYDSRFFGAVKKENIIGKIFLIDKKGK